MRFFILIPFLFFVTGCPTQESFPELNLEGIFSSVGLEGISINSLDQFEGKTYAATDSGLFKTTVGISNTWISLGLEAKNVIDIVFLAKQKLLAAIRLQVINEGKPTLFFSEDGGQSWHPQVNNYGGESGEYTFVSSLESFSKPSDTLFAHSADRTIAKSVNGGKQWEIVVGRWDNFGGSSQTVYINPFYQQTIWATGASALGEPYILKSNDSGKTWSNLSVLKNIEAICYDVITSQNEENVVLAGLGAGFEQALIIRRSTDGGDNWSTVFEGINTLTLTQSARNPEIIYASGQDASGSLFFIATNNFGDTWETVEFEEGPTQIQVNDMISVLKNGKEVLYFGTNKGVYSYTLEN